MPISDPKNPLVPNFNILVNSSLLPVEPETHVTSITVDNDTELASMFSFELVNSEWHTKDLQWIDKQQELFTVGNAIEIKLGYGDNLETIIYGEITGLEPEFNFNRLPKLTVRGYDRRHRLQRGQKTRTFVEQKDSDIAAQIAIEGGFTPIVEESRVIHPYLLQANQTDLAFLQQRARSIQYQVTIEDRKLFFQPIANADSPTLTLNLADDLLEFYPCLSSIGQVSEVTVCSSNPSGNQQQLAWRSIEGDEVSRMGGKDSAAILTERAFGSAVETIVDRPVMTLAEAEQMAKAKFNQIALSLITGEGVCRGRTDLHSGNMIEINGVGKQFSGQYYVTATRHRYRSSGNYTTHLSVQRNAV
jgi:uncharacterized protein